MNNFANKYKGETELKVAGESYCMVLNMGALLEIEEKVCPLHELRNIANSLRKTMQVAEILINTSGENITFEDLKTLPAHEFKNLVKSVTKALNDGLTATTGDLEEEEEPESQSQEDEVQETGEDDSGKLPEPVNENEPSSKEDGIDG